MTQVQAGQSLTLRFGTALIVVESQDGGILERLQRYFHGFATDLRDRDYPRAVVRLSEAEAQNDDAGLTLWKTGGKEGFVDLLAGRIVRKIRTGVEITIEEDSWTPVWTMYGPLQRNFSQVVNVIDTIYGIGVLDRGGAMIHASAVCREGRAVAVMGQSGMGKSSVAVRLLENGFDYISNDRVLLEASPGQVDVQAHGLPKLPRVNPGTLLEGDRTRLLLEDEARKYYEKLPPDELWQVEDKHDVEVETFLGRRWLLAGNLVCALALDWHRDGEGLDVQRLTAGQALEELRSVRKSFGAFDLRLSRRLDTALVETAERVPVYRVTGKADPSRLASELTVGGLRELS